MTAQISDGLKFQCKPFSIAAVSDEGLFQPQSHGIEPVMISTACYRGFYCSYEIIDNSLYLMDVHLATKECDSLGVRYGKTSGPQLFGRLPKIAKHDRCWSYQSVHQPIFYSGGILIADGFIRELYVHMGFHPAYKYKTVYELIFEEGHLTNFENCSAQMADLRERIASESSEPGGSAGSREIKRWIEQCFDRSYRR